MRLVGRHARISRARRLGHVDAARRVSFESRACFGQTPIGCAYDFPGIRHAVAPRSLHGCRAGCLAPPRRGLQLVLRRHGDGRRRFEHGHVDFRRRRCRGRRRLRRRHPTVEAPRARPRPARGQVRFDGDDRRRAHSISVDLAIARVVRRGHGVVEHRARASVLAAVSVRRTTPSCTDTDYATLLCRWPRSATRGIPSRLRWRASRPRDPRRSTLR